MTETGAIDVDVLLAEAGAMRLVGLLDEAGDLYARILTAAPEHPEALAGAGLVLFGLGHAEAAVDFYLRSLALRPGQAEVLYHFGQALRLLERPDVAAQAFRESLSLSPSAAVFRTLAQTEQQRGEMEGAIAAYRGALALDPGHGECLAQLVHLLRQNCEWGDVAGLESRLLAQVREGAAGIPPFVILSLDGATPADQLAAGRAWSLRYEPDGGPLPPPPPPRTGGRLRIGYLSADYHEHATAYLIAELFELHDRTRFEIFAYSTGPDGDNPMRRRLEAGVDHFVKLRSLSDREAAERIRADGIDILVDLKGYTKGTRMGILGYRPAPVQASFLGYPGTSGAAFVDRLIADPVVIPPAHRGFYSETLDLLPHCYQPNDSRRPIAEPAPTRAGCGLPEDGLVFCSFNSTYKITPPVFAVWMRLLHAVPGSVLWLFASNPWAELNLRRQVMAAGLGADRVVFAHDLPLAGHLARYRLADLFLDTLPYTGHTTVSDALWSGLPAVTCAGDSFAGLVAASLLKAVDLPELIAPDLDAYEALAMRLAGDAAGRTRLRETLARNRSAAPLFDTARYARDLEALYLGMAGRGN